MKSHINKSLFITIIILLGISVFIEATDSYIHLKKYVLGLLLILAIFQFVLFYKKQAD